MGDKYIVDSNVFITTHRQIYPFDIEYIDLLQFMRELGIKL